MLNVKICPPHALRRVHKSTILSPHFSLPSTRRNTTPSCARKWVCRPSPPESFFTNQLFDFLWKGDVRDSSANNMTERTELPAASLSRFSRFLMEIHEMRFTGHALPQISMAKQKSSISLSNSPLKIPGKLERADVRSNFHSYPE